MRTNPGIGTCLAFNRGVPTQRNQEQDHPPLPRLGGHRSQYKGETIVGRSQLILLNRALMRQAGSRKWWFPNLIRLSASNEHSSGSCRRCARSLAHTTPCSVKVFTLINASRFWSTCSPMQPNTPCGAQNTPQLSKVLVSSVLHAIPLVVFAFDFALSFCALLLS